MQAVRRRLQIFLVLFLLITFSGTVMFMVLEKISFADALYYNIVTMSTVGYGDIHPTRPASRLVAVFLIIMGGATFLGVIANATEILILKRENRGRMKKVNMVMGAFFSEVGYRLLGIFAAGDVDIAVTRATLLVGFDWTAEQFRAAGKALAEHPFRVDSRQVPLETLCTFLNRRKGFLVSLMENPVLIEQETFSETLLAVFHLADELECRGEALCRLPGADIRHLENDMNRAYQKLVGQWLDYLRHLKTHYPYLYSLAVRQNPFDPGASPILSA